ncbi:MAG: hypothetical protein HN764_01085 [Gammaproteobacteria bacterium]|jgi:hypothetical protein|nr:hypothetical protein [Gammaproteobacteria bacterium]
MTHSFASPTDADLENLVKRAFETMPVAEPSRLSFIENQLMQKAANTGQRKSLNKMPWWIVLLLSGSFAMAGWLGGNYLLDHSEDASKTVPQEDNIIVPARTETRKNNVPKTPGESEDDAVYIDDDSPVIYQREVL